MPDPIFSLSVKGQLFPEMLLTGVLSGLRGDEIIFDDASGTLLSATLAPFFTGPPGPAGGTISNDPDNQVGLGTDGGVFVAPPLQLSSAQW